MTESASAPSLGAWSCARVGFIGGLRPNCLGVNHELDVACAAVSAAIKPDQVRHMLLQLDVQHAGRPMVILVGNGRKFLQDLAYRK